MAGWVWMSGFLPYAFLQFQCGWFILSPVCLSNAYLIYTVVSNTGLKPYFITLIISYSLLHLANNIRLHK